MNEQQPHTPIPWPMLILTFVLSTILLVSLCLAILDTSGMELIRAPGPAGSLPALCRGMSLTAQVFL